MESAEMRILIVDDSRTILHVLNTILRELGYTNIVEADTVPKAIDLCKDNPPALIFSDWNMPGSSGLDFLKYIKGNPQTAQIPFIMLTTETDRSKIVQATRAGLQSYLLKPIKKQTIAMKLKELSDTFGFNPPQLDPDLPVFPNPVIEEIKHPLKGILKKEHIASILEVYRKLWKQEITIADFEAFIKNDMFNDYPQDHISDLDMLLKTIQNAGREGILNRLIQLV